MEREIKFLNQPYCSKKCGQTCLAMITGKTLEQVCSELDKYWETSISDDLQPYLENNGYKTKLVKSNKLTFEDSPNNSIIRMCFENGSGHFIVKANNKYYEPTRGIIEQLIGHFRVTHYLSFE